MGILWVLYCCHKFITDWVLYCCQKFVTSSSPIGEKLLSDSTPNSITKTLEQYQQSCFTPQDNSIEREAQ
ncbi:hypothetical protein SO802_024968, partial [Lithocarpus litseifolius]